MYRVCLVILCSAFALVGAGSADGQNLLVNPDFEAGLTGWTTWSAPASGFWNGSWIHSNDCDIWVPPSECPYGGTGISHAQKKGSGSGNAHGGIYQVVAVEPGVQYRVDGVWSGGVTPQIDGDNGTWWEITVYDGTVGATEIDAAPGASDVVIAKTEVNNLSSGSVHQFDWQPFSGNFVALSNSVTLAIKTGSYYTFDAAGYHDNLSLSAVPVAAIPAVDHLGLIVLASLIALVGVIRLSTP